MLGSQNVFCDTTASVKEMLSPSMMWKLPRIVQFSVAVMLQPPVSNIEEVSLNLMGSTILVGPFTQMLGELADIALSNQRSRSF
jgi:hypothetical protein